MFDLANDWSSHGLSLGDVLWLILSWCLLLLLMIGLLSLLQLDRVVDLFVHRVIRRRATEAELADTWTVVNNVLDLAIPLSLCLALLLVSVVFLV